MFYSNSGLRCVVVCCSVLQCVVVCCSVLQCVAVCCSVLQCVAAIQGSNHRGHPRTLGVCVCIGVILHIYESNNGLFMCKCSS